MSITWLFEIVNFKNTQIHNAQKQFSLLFLFLNN